MVSVFQSVIRTRALALTGRICSHHSSRAARCDQAFDCNTSSLVHSVTRLEYVPAKVWHFEKPSCKSSITGVNRVWFSCVCYANNDGRAEAFGTYSFKPKHTGVLEPRNRTEQHVVDEESPPCLIYCISFSTVFLVSIKPRKLWCVVRLTQGFCAYSLCYLLFACLFV